ncbi:MAG: hypothetical protein KIT02_05675 [Devosia sp.]|uniref:hypothetical protein n=1 Tax=Devosia sp. TaxID=1871048 RepID=UPI0024C6188D|nr:hypothetical protein [Devosia sp.]UYO00702.1 MAG: hypothetical protein KIT02_05675 [Devosia sp.]
MLRSPAVLALVTALMSTLPTGAQEFPREGNAAIPNGTAAPFVGQWSAGFPDDKNTIVTTTVISCDDPVLIEAVDDVNLSLSRNNDIEPPVIVELSEFSNRTSWFPVNGGLSSIAVWIDEDSFYRYEVDATGKADWDWPFLYRRCP